MAGTDKEETDYQEKCAREYCRIHDWDYDVIIRQYGLFPLFFMKPLEYNTIII